MPTKKSQKKKPAKRTKATVACAPLRVLQLAKLRKGKVVAGPEVYVLGVASAATEDEPRQYWVARPGDESPTRDFLHDESHLDFLDSELAEIPLEDAQQLWNELEPYLKTNDFECSSSAQVPHRSVLVDGVWYDSKFFSDKELKRVVLKEFKDEKAQAEYATKLSQAIAAGEQYDRKKSSRSKAPRATNQKQLEKRDEYLRRTRTEVEDVGEGVIVIGELADELKDATTAGEFSQVVRPLVKVVTTTTEVLAGEPTHHDVDEVTGAIDHALAEGSKQAANLDVQPMDLDLELMAEMAENLERAKDALDELKTAVNKKDQEKVDKTKNAIDEFEIAIGTKESSSAKTVSVKNPRTKLINQGKWQGLRDKIKDAISSELDEPMELKILPWKPQDTFSEIWKRLKCPAGAVTELTSLKNLWDFVDTIAVKPLLFQVRTGTSGDMIAAMVLFPYSELGHKDTISVAVACVAPGVWKTVEKTLIEFAKEHKKHLKLPPDYDIVELETKLTAKKQTPKAGKQASAQSLLTALEQIRKEVIKIGKRARSQALSVVDSKTLQTELDKYEKQLKTIKPKIRKVTGGEKQDELDEFYAEVQEELHDARNTVTKEAGQKVSKKSKKK